MSVFEIVLGDRWDTLGAVIRRHYFLRPFSDDKICVRGEMSVVKHSLIAKLFLPMGLLFGAVVPYRGENVPIAVYYNASRDNANLYWDRVFRFQGKKPFHFRSHMEQLQRNEVIEFVRYGIGMRMIVTAEEGAIVFRDNGYVWRLFGRNIPVPIGLFFGRAYVEERPIDDNSFSMKMTIRHGLFGELFRYEGRFSLGDSADQ